MVAWAQSGSTVMLNPLQKGVVLRGERHRGRAGVPGRGEEPGSGQVDPEAALVLVLGLTLRLVFVAAFHLQPAASCWSAGRGSAVHVVSAVHKVLKRLPCLERQVGLQVFCLAISTCPQAAGWQHAFRGLLHAS